MARRNSPGDTIRTVGTRSLQIIGVSFLLLCFPCDVAEAQCPQECNCFGTFVSCYNFTEWTLYNLPSNAETVILNGGKIKGFTNAFVSDFPSLTFLEIQSTHVESVGERTFSGIKGLDQLAITDCRLDVIETGAYKDLSAVTQILMSNLTIGTIQSSAFSGIRNVGKFSIWSSRIGRIEPRAFEDMADFDSFEFYLNNVTSVAQGAFVYIENIGKVDVSVNVFASIDSSAVASLSAATADVNMYSNTFPCECGLLRAFHSPALSRYIPSQKCAMPGSGAEVAVLSEVDVTPLCANQPTTVRSSTLRVKTSTPRPASTTTPSFTNTTTTTTTTATKPLTNKTTSNDSNETPSVASTTAAFHGTTASGTAASGAVTSQSTTPVDGDVTTRRSTGGKGSGRGQNSGLTGDPSRSSGKGARVSVAQSSLVWLLSGTVAAWRMVSGAC